MNCVLVFTIGHASPLLLIARRVVLTHSHPHHYASSTAFSPPQNTIKSRERMSTVKLNLKYAKEAIVAKKYDDALKWTEKVLDSDSENYMA